MTVPALPLDAIQEQILIVRGHKVLLDNTLAALYGVAPKVLLQAVRRHLARFPVDFMFRLSAEEFAALRSQIVTSNAGRGGRRYAPYVFTEQGVAMLSSVLNSPRAIAVNIESMRAFVRLRAAIAGNQELTPQVRRTRTAHGTETRQSRSRHRRHLAGDPPTDDAARTIAAPDRVQHPRINGLLASSLSNGLAQRKPGMARRRAGCRTRSGHFA
ncbi:MAG: ORF6N domain-containing protein [Rhodanobacteraceae bacterium]